MIGQNELKAIAQDALRDLGDRDWKVAYTTAEGEEFHNAEPLPETAINVRFDFRDGRGGFMKIHVRVEPADNRNPEGRNQWLKEGVIRDKPKALPDLPAATEATPERR